MERGEIRVDGADGLVSVTVDAQGGLIDLTIDDRAMGWSADALALAVGRATQEAQRVAREQALGVVAESEVPSTEGLSAKLDEIQALAQRQLNVYSEALYDLSRRADRGR